MDKYTITPAALGAAVEGNLTNFIAAVTPGGIEAQEAAGQKDFVKSRALPVEAPWDKLKELGFLELEDCNELSSKGELFCKVEFPNGWSIEPTSHSMWSDLKDNKGRKRGSIFYKAAFYDRSASLRLNPRYHYNYFPEDMYKSDIAYDERERGKWFGAVLDAESTVIFETKHIILPQGGSSERYEVLDKLSQEAKEWLLKKFPGYTDSSLYWG